MDHHRGGDHAVKLMPSAYQWPDTSAPKVPRSSGVETRGHAMIQKSTIRAYVAKCITVHDEMTNYRCTDRYYNYKIKTLIS